jgi:hypothetical protein
MINAPIDAVGDDDADAAGEEVQQPEMQRLSKEVEGEEEDHDHPARDERLDEETPLLQPLAPAALVMPSFVA